MPFSGQVAITPLDLDIHPLSKSPTRGQSRNSVPRVPQLPVLTPPTGRQVPIFVSEPLGPSELPSHPQSNATKPTHGRAGARASTASGSVVRQVFSSTRDAAASSITWR